VNKDTSNLTLFIESACADHRLLQKVDSMELKEALIQCPSRIRESVSSDEPSGWWVPISFYNKINGNNRNYNKQLWENVRDRQKETWCGSPMLCDHPSGDSDGNPKDICGVWLDMKLGEPNCNGCGLVYGLLMPSGHHGSDLQDHLKNGLKIGTSSSGFGKLMRDGVTVDPDTFMIERLADWVLNPSQGTYFSYDESSDEVINKSNNMSESLNNTNNNIDTLEESNNIKETCMKDSKLTKLEEKKFRRDMESFLESANNIVDPQERLEEFKDIRSYFEDGVCSDLKEKVEAKIVEQEEEIKKMLNERIEMKNDLGVDSVKELKEKLTQVAEEVKLTEKEAKDWKEISEQLQEKLAETSKALDDRPTQQFVEYQKTKISKLEESLNEHDNKAADVVKELAGAYKSMKESNEGLTKIVEGLNTEKENLTKQVESFNKLVEEQRETVETLTEKYSALEENYKRALKEIKLFKELLNKNKVLFEKAFKNTDVLNESKKNNEEKINSLQESLDKSNRDLRVAKVKESIKMRPALSETEEFYESLRKTYGEEVEAYKEKIVGAVTLAEAKKYFYQKVFNNLQESQEIADMRLPESMAISNEDRAQYILHESVERTSSVDRLPKGWM